MKKGLLFLLLLTLVACSSGVEDLPELELEDAGAATEKVSLKVNHDAEENSSGRSYIHGIDLELGYKGGERTVGLRFDGLNVPKGATITNAYLQLQADESDSGYVKLAIRAETADNKHTRRKHDISERKTTSSAVTWEPEAWRRGERGAKQRSPNLASVVQEVVNDKEWRRGHTLGLVITGLDGGKRVAESLNGDRENRAQLVVEYEAGTRQPAEPVRDSGRGVPIIIDTDSGFDVDDIGGAAVLHALADNGEADILATISVVTDPHTPSAIDAVNTYYGRPNIPIGQNDNAPRHYRWDKAYPYWRDAPRFVKYMDREFPNDIDGRNVPSALATYRKVLAAQPNNSVTIVVTGFTKNLADLLKSGPDRYSSLSGQKLVARKVKKLVIMGGSYPGNDRDFNLTGGPARSPKDTKHVLENWPTELVFTGGELCGPVFTGRTLRDSRNNPVARAYELFGSRNGRNSWDLCSVLYAVRGNTHEGRTYFSEDSSRRLAFRGIKHYWKSGGRANQKRLELETSVSTLERVLEQLLTQPPK